MLLYADEDFSYPVVEALRQLGHDVMTAQDDGRTGTADPQILARAHSLGRAVLTGRPWWASGSSTQPGGECGQAGPVRSMAARTLARVIPRRASTGSAAQLGGGPGRLFGGRGMTCRGALTRHCARIQRPVAGLRVRRRLDRRGGSRGEVLAQPVPRDGPARVARRSALRFEPGTRAQS